MICVMVLGLLFVWLCFGLSCMKDSWRFMGGNILGDRHHLARDLLLCSFASFTKDSSYYVLSCFTQGVQLRCM